MHYFVGTLTAVRTTLSVVGTNLSVATFTLSVVRTTLSFVNNNLSVRETNKPNKITARLQYSYYLAKCFSIYCVNKLLRTLLAKIFGVSCMHYSIGYNIYYVSDTHNSVGCMLYFVGTLSAVRTTLSVANIYTVSCTYYSVDYNINVSVKSKLQHAPPPGKPPGF